MIHTKIAMHLRGVVCEERSQTQKATRCRIPRTGLSGKGKTIWTESKPVGVCWGHWGCGGDQVQKAVMELLGVTGVLYSVIVGSVHNGTVDLKQHRLELRGAARACGVFW